jgi:hypothetical protein
MLVITAATFSLNGSAQKTSVDGQAADPIQFVVGPRATLMPKGVFLLVRKGKSIGAVRFTDIVVGSEVGLGKAAYESYFQGDGAKSWLQAGGTRKSGLIELKPLVGIGRFAFQTGQNRIDIGPWSFGCSHPGSLNMWPYRGDSKDYGYEFAPTSASNVTELDSADKRLEWFKFDEHTSVKVPLVDLPK